MGLVASLGSLVLLITLTPVVNWWATWLAGPWNDPRGDTVVVPTGSVIADGMIGLSSYWRCVYTVRAWREGGFRELILTGDPRATAAMRAFVTAEGVPGSVIRIEEQSATTRESAVNVARLLGAPGRPVVLLTSDYHMFRAARAFRKAGLPILPRPFPDARKRGQVVMERWSVFLDLGLESLKIAYYGIRGWI